LTPVLAIVWTLALLPPQLLEWSGRAGAPAWALWMFDHLGYASLMRMLEGLDTYVLFGAPVAVSVLLVWWSLRPALSALGWSGRALAWGWFGLAPVTVTSYLVGDGEGPLRFLWGAEAPWCLLLFVWAVVVALVAPRDRGVPRSVRLLVGLTAVFGAAGTILATYYPHGTVVGIAVQAMLIARWPVGPADDERPAVGALPESSPAQEPSLAR